MKNAVDDIFGGLAAALVALPSAIAYGLIIYAPLGAFWAPKAAIAGIVGTAVLGLVAALVGGSSRLISAPCAPAAAVLSVFTASLVAGGQIPVEAIPFAITITAVLAGAIQIAVGLAGGGRLIKYIPYPVVAGYMTGVGTLILLGQIPKLLAVPKGTALLTAITNSALWQPESVTVGVVTIAAMLLSTRFLKSVPAAIIALAAGISAYFLLAIFNPELLVLEGTHLVIGPVGASPGEVWKALALHWSPAAIGPAFRNIALYAVPVLTLAVLLSIDALKTCVVLDVMTGERHNSNRVLLGQGLGNAAASLFGGVPGAGTMGPSLVNFNSGGKTSRSGILMGVFSLITLFVLGKLISWIPLSALSGVLIVVAVNMMDFKSFRLLQNKSTVLDFVVIMAVVVAAITQDLIMAAGVGIGMAIILFLREQIRFSVVHRSYTAANVHSKKRRLKSETVILEEIGSSVSIFELQGQLFFGTADQLYTELEPIIAGSRIIILDMRRVLAIDYTAANVFKQIHNRIKERGATLVLSQVPAQLAGRQDIIEYLAELGFTDNGTSLRFIDDLDTAMEWTEETVLRENGARAAGPGPSLEVREFEFFGSFTRKLVSRFSEIMVPAFYNTGSSVFHKGDLSNQIYFIRRGSVKIILPIGGSTQIHHLATFGKGDFFGEMAFLDKAPRSADAVCAEETELFILKRKDFKKVLSNFPEMGTIFYTQLARTITGRLRMNHAEIQALEGSVG